MSRNSYSPFLNAARSCALLVLLAGSTPTTHSAPAWWNSRHVVASDPTAENPSPAPQDYAAANQGQLKNMARGALEELSNGIAPETGSELEAKLNDLKALVQSWPRGTGAQGATQDYAMVTLGQVKGAAKLVWDILSDCEMGGEMISYPWTNVDPQDFAAANIGQIKHAFDFELSRLPNFAEPRIDLISESTEVKLHAGSKAKQAIRIETSDDKATFTWDVQPSNGVTVQTSNDGRSATLVFTQAGLYTANVICRSGVFQFRRSQQVTVSPYNDIRVFAGLNKEADLGPSGEVTVNLNDATVVDDALPSDGQLKFDWLGFDDAVTFTPASGTSDPAQSIPAGTVATFSKPGIFRIELRASDGQNDDQDSFAMTIRGAVSVDAGPDRAISYGHSIGLEASSEVYGPATYQWTQVSATPASGVASFEQGDTLTPRASFSQPGTYVLRLTATTTGGSKYDEVTITTGTVAGRLLPAITGLSGYGLNQRVTLVWDEEWSGSVDHYHIYRATSSSGPWSSIGEVTTPKFVDRNVTNGTKMFYKVTAVRSTDQLQACESIDSDVVEVTPTTEVIGPMDVVLIVDNTTTMLSALANIRSELADIVGDIETASGTDYRIALLTTDDQSVTIRVPFCLNNGVVFQRVMRNLPMADGGASRSQQTNAWTR